MKIEFDPQSNIPAKSQAKKTESNPDNKTFGQVMAETVKVDATSEHSQKTLTPAAPISPLSLGLMENRVNAPEGVTKVEQLLDLLDQYRNYLEDPRNSLREMEPLVQKMATKLKDLSGELERLDPQDPLASILTETMMTASLEVEKYNNGLYNPV